MASINLLSFNAKGLKDEEKRLTTFNWLKKQKAYIILLQETHSYKESEKDWKKNWGGQIIFSHGTSGARGVSILIDKGLNHIINEQKTDDDGRIVIIDMNIDKNRFIIANIYAPNADSPAFFMEVNNLLDNFSNNNMIIGGDFKADKRGGRQSTHEKCRKYLLNMMESLELFDIWRREHPAEFGYTWKSYTSPYIYCRLDFFLVSFNILSMSKNNRILAGPRSDHNAVKLPLKLNNQKRGPGFWKLNCSLLEEEEYKNTIKKCINECIQDNKGTDDGLMWETIKCRIRGTSIKYSANKKRVKNNNISILEEELNKLQKDIVNNSNPELLNDRIRKINCELDKFRKEELMGQIIRSKCQYYELGEKGSKYFHSLEKRNQENKNIKMLITDDGQTLQDPTDILNEEVRFYEDLYSSKLDIRDRTFNINIDKFFVDSQHTEIASEDLAITFNGDELKEIIDTFTLNKSPGSDGLPIEFYKCFWPNIRESLILNYKQFIVNNELSLTQKQGVITLIPKKDKDPTRLKNWRPITLLNTDYKILTKYIANYLKQHLNDMIHTNQKGFLQGRNIGENINNAVAIIDYCNKHDIDAMLIFLYYNKAFDSIEWSIIEKSLKYFGFKDNIINCVNYIYKNNSSCIVNNGNISTFFNLNRGLRQGCPLSPYLFIMVVEILAIMIRNNKKIKGISLNNYVCKLNQYADDMFISTLNDNDSVHEIFSMINDFSTISGLTLNQEKTEVLYIGNRQVSRLIDKSWLKHEVNLLGVKISKNNNNTIDSNYNHKLIKIENCLKIWQQRDLSLLGKIHIIRSLANSQLVYNWSNLVKPKESFFKELETKLYNFLWNSKVDRVKRKTMIAPYDEGGLKMLDSRTQCKSLKLKWIKHIKDSIEKPVKDFWYMWLLKCIPNMDIIDFLCRP